ncbi:PQQ-binding-like beta-propeller repeat protein [Planctomicrobium sp. SH527]|uniref:PQQ-binding-like beta-propeller repeat protein n=1 Tax=Planctomicrobium sp. SH527 TaxID=3448123 RepID=UPI003F5C8C50
MNRLLLTTLFSAALFCLSETPAQAVGPDWPYWVGPQYTGISPERGIPEKWDPKGGPGSNVLWDAPIGSRSTPIIMNERLYLVTNSNEDDINKAGEKVVCLDANTGKVLWEHAFNVYLTDVPIERIGWSSVVGDPETGNVYVQGVCGYFCCLNGKTGEVVWERSLHEEFGFLTTYGGRTNYPLIHEGNVIISAVVIGWGEQAKPNHRFLAMDKSNGQVVWYVGTRPLPEDTTYSAPVIGVVDGELQMVCGGGDGAVHGFQPRTGKKLWTYNLSAHGVNTTPLLHGDRVYIGHSEENLDSNEMGALLCIDAKQRGDISKTGTIWKKTQYAVGRSSPIMIENRLYFVDDRAKLYCVDPETGNEVGKSIPLGTMMRANLLYVDGKIFINEVNGRGYILKPTEKGAEFVHKYRFPRGDECYGSPIAWRGRVYIPTTGHMYCVGNAELVEAEAVKASQARETHIALDERPAQLSVVPTESLLVPGARQQFQARLYNAKGQYLRNAHPDEVEFSLQGPGEFDNSGRYTIQSTQTQHQGVIVTAKHRNIEGTARIRVIPSLNWSFDFNDGKVPETWVGCSYRHVPLDWDLLSKLKAENAFASDLYIYFMTEFANFGPKREFDDSTPQQRLKGLLTFLNLAEGEDKPKTLDEFKAKFDAGLQKLVDENVISGFTWSTWDRKTGNGEETVPEAKLSIERGERKIDGNGVICKVTTIPKGTRSQGWMGPTDLTNYTIQSDVLSFSRLGKLPDAGLIGQRYTFDLMGASKQLQVRTWTPQLNRFSASVSFEWKPEVWYTMKLKTSVKDGKALVQGKIWVRGEPEPEAWSIEAADISPNLIGSPGLFGNTKDGEFFYDNLTVTRNAE